ncbi:MAG: ABC transporter permease [Rhodospirillaceae bacterium]|jgi:putative hydroxymethylpyrimidine transport system permease protein|nr:ABC transporter permease [Rhodospirillaceae bacterium]MBT5194267.1 ABC transporter permease [Rhodospirillaceae bacterium]MBT5895584.1 ABC transporter permease [Rhodospirillaceae bacterium]MBT6428430.1 ABC transporter permease [Rhodospirillaceae bacterium]MBT7757040.1 ABC transporter permease [Rhodospirillaceae bacterium]
MQTAARTIITLAVLLAGWQVLVWVTGVEFFILPGPWRVLQSLADNVELIGRHAAITLLEIVLGLICGSALGVLSAIALSWFPVARRWLLPLLVVAQAIPVFALAPVLVLWLGYGLASKVMMASLIIFFPVTTAFLDGLRRTEPGWLDLAHTMTGPGGRQERWAQLRYIRIPAALPALASGLRVAAAVAPIGAVVGEWVGSSAGLGYLMLHANGRMQIDLLFAALFVLAAMAVTLFFSLDWLLRRLLPWQPDSLPTE